MIDISIVVTAYNYALYIDECLDSCLKQTCNELEYEVIVVNDGSTDDTHSLLRRRSDPRLRIIHIENSGIEIASNVGFKAAIGRYIVRVDADDVLEANYLARMARWVDQGHDFIYSDYSIIDKDGHSKGIVRLPAFDQSEIISRGDFLATGTLYAAKLLRDYGYYATHTKNSGLENHELIVKLIAGGARGCHVGECLFRYRRHSANISTNRIESIVSTGKKLYKSHGLGEYRTNQYHPYKLVLQKETS